MAHEHRNDRKADIRAAPEKDYSGNIWVLAFALGTTVLAIGAAVLIGLGQGG